VDEITNPSCYKQIQRNVEKIKRAAFIQKGINIQDTILISSTPRAGSTWLMELLGNISGYSTLFEPFHPEFFPISREIIRSQYRPYISFDENWKMGENYLGKAFTGKIISNSPQFKLKPGIILSRLFSTKLIVKCVRTNRLLPFIARKFSLKGIILLIRHPCSTIASQIRTGYTGYFEYPSIDIKKEMVLKEAAKIKNLNRNILQKINELETKEEILSAIWCLDNFVPLSHSQPYPWIVVSYENLIKNGKTEIQRIFDFLDISEDTNRIIKELKVPSLFTASKNPNKITNDSYQLAKWRNILSTTQVENILDVLSVFDMDFYSEDEEPDYARLYG